MRSRVGAENSSEEISLSALHLSAFEHCFSKHASKGLFLLVKECFKLGDSFTQIRSLYLTCFLWISQLL